MSSRNRLFKIFIALGASTICLVSLVSCSNNEVVPEEVYRKLGYVKTQTSLTLPEILDQINNCSQNILGSNLVTFLAGSQIKPEDEQQASYVLAKLLLNRCNDIENYSDKDIFAFSKIALALFDKASNLEPLHYLCLEHKVEIYIILGKEKKVRETVELLLKARPKSVSKYNYWLAQSYVRSKEYNNAAIIFTQLINNDSLSNYGIGSLYYMGLINENTQSGPVLNDKALRFYLDYLLKEPCGRFSGEILTKLAGQEDKLNLTANPKYNTSMVKVYVNSGQWGKALKYLNKLKPDDAYYLENAYILAKANQAIQAKILLLASLKKNIDLTKRLTDISFIQVANEIAKHLNSHDTFLFFQELYNQHLSYDLDAILWNLAKRDKSGYCYYEKILKLTPKSSYAPLAAYVIDFNDYLKLRHNQAALNKLKIRFNTDYSKYKNSVKATAYLFWLGKICLSLQDKTSAKKAFEQVQKIIFPDYYVYKAGVELAKLNNKPPLTALTLDSRYREIQVQDWHWPSLSELVKLSDITTDYDPTIAMLSYLHQYNECLNLVQDAKGNIPLFKAWLYANLNDNHRAIDLAYKTQSQPINSEPNWQMSFPLIYLPIVKNAAKTNKLNPRFILAIMREESRFDSSAVSSANAYGLMQLIPSTAMIIAQDLHFKISDTQITKALLEPSINITFGSLYLTRLVKSFKGNVICAIAAYNAGPGAVQSWLKLARSKGIDDLDLFIETIPVSETRDYVKKVMTSFWSYNKVYPVSILPK